MKKDAVLFTAGGVASGKSTAIRAIDVVRLARINHPPSSGRFEDMQTYVVHVHDLIRAHLARWSAEGRLIPATEGAFAVTDQNQWPRPEQTMNNRIPSQTPGHPPKSLPWNLVGSGLWG